MQLEEFMKLGSGQAAPAPEAEPAGPESGLDFSTTLSPLGTPPAVQQAFAAGAQRLGAACAAEYDALCRALAAREHVPAGQLVCGAGRGELLRRLLVCIAPQRAVLPAPCPTAAEQVFAAMGCTVSRCMLWETRGFAMGEAFPAAVNTETALAYLPQPCDPTGLLASPELAFAILDKCARMGTYLIADESLLEFTDKPAEHSLLRYVPRYPNLIVLRSFSSIYAMPGAPLAYCVTSNPVLLEKLSALAVPPVLSAGVCLAGAAALQCREHLQRTRVLVHLERPKLAAALRDAGLAVYESDANFLLVRAERTDLAQALAAEGVRVKGCGGCAGLSDAYCRVAVRTAAENAVLVRAVRKVLAG